MTGVSAAGGGRALPADGEVQDRSDELDEKAEQQPEPLGAAGDLRLRASGQVGERPGEEGQLDRHQRGDEGEREWRQVRQRPIDGCPSPFVDACSRRSRAAACILRPLRGACYPCGTVSDRPIRPAYLISGSDRPKVRRALARLRGRVVAETGSDLNITVFDAETATATDVLAAAEMPGLTLGTRLLLVVNAHAWKAEARRALAAYLTNPMPDTCLAVEGATFTEADALRKAIVALAAREGVDAKDLILTFDLPKKKEMAEWVKKRAEAHRLPMSLGAARHFLERCGEEPHASERLEREIEKLAVYCRGHEATSEEIDAICTPDDDARIFSLMDAVGDRQSSRAFQLLEMVYLAGDDPNKVLFMLIRHVEQLGVAMGFDAGDVGTLAKQLGLPYWAAKRLLDQATHYDRVRLAQATKALAVAEAGMRGRPPATLETESGVNHTGRLVLELALARLLA